MRTWLIALGGLLVWTVHFFGLYAIAETARSAGMALALTGVCLAADLWLLRRAIRLPAGGSFARWRRSVALGAAGIALLAIGWQALPAVIG